MANMTGIDFLVKASPDLNRLTPDIITAGGRCYGTLLPTF